MGAQKNRLNEMVLFSTQHICSKLMDEKIFKILHSNFCSSKPMGLIWIQTVSGKNSFERVEFEKNQQMTSDNEKIPIMQRVNP